MRRWRPYPKKALSPIEYLHCHPQRGIIRVGVSGEASSGVYREATLDRWKGEHDRLQSAYASVADPFPLHT